MIKEWCDNNTKLRLEVNSEKETRLSNSFFISQFVEVFMLADFNLNLIKEKFNIFDSNNTREYVYNHAARVAWSIFGFTSFLELDIFQQYKMIQLAIFHDIGKFGVEPSILFKKERLDPSDIVCIRKHSIYGEDYLNSIANLNYLSPCIRHHHERWDGSGYPDGLIRNEILFESRILSLADAFDAMTSDRCYRKALSVAEALQKIDLERGRQFDPQLSRQFIKYIELHKYRSNNKFKSDEAINLYGQICYNTLLPYRFHYFEDNK